jgi:hypothetical protein
VLPACGQGEAKLHCGKSLTPRPPPPTLQVAVDNYTEWIQLLAQLTIRSLNSWQWAQDSIFYLLGLWGRLVSSMPYLKGDSPSLLDTNVPQIMQAYITSRWGRVTHAAQPASHLQHVCHQQARTHSFAAYTVQY